MPNLAFTTKSHIFHLVISYPKCRFASSKCGSKKPVFDLGLHAQLNTPSRLYSHELGTRAVYTNTHGCVYHMANVSSATGRVWGVAGLLQGVSHACPGCMGHLATGMAFMA